MRTLALALLFVAIGAQAATLSESPATVVRGGSASATWSGIATPTSTDWIALFAVGAPDNGYQSWRYTSGTASGSVPFTIPAGVAPGTYELRLFANNGYTKLATSSTFTVTTPTLSASPASVTPGGTENATWADIPAPTPTDWIGLYTPSAADTAYLAFRYTSGAASGSVPFTIPAGTAAGTYQLRLFSSNGYSRLAVSNNFTVGAWSVSGTVTLGGAPLGGVAFSAGAGTSCLASDASGQYSCSVPQGWSGMVTPSLSGYLFTPASRSYGNLAGNQTAQDYAATPSYQVSGTVTSNGSPLAGVAFSGADCGLSDASGQYSCTVPQGWSGTVTPSLSSYVFTPASRSYANVVANQTAQDYSGNPFYQVSGTITAGGSALSGVTVTATNGVSCSTTDGSGQYSCTVAGGWSGAITPSLAGYNFGPVSRNYGAVAANQTAQDFAGSAASLSSRISFIHVDHLDTPRLITDASQQVIWRNDNTEPFGDSVPDENPSGLGAFEFPMMLSLYYRDKETGQRYAQMRDCYDPLTGRFCQSDPIGLMGGINTFAYVRNDPLRYTDPFGLFDPTGFTETALATAAGVTVATIVGGIALALVPSSIAEEDAPSRTIPKPKKPSCGCTCICRADADDRIPGNIKPNRPRFAFGQATAENCPKAVKEAKRIATHNLGMQPKHIPCKCAGS